jgi:hypothetical protein
MTTYRITWVERDTRNAACLGLDETIESDWTEEESREAAEYRAECAGVDLERYECIMEEIESREAMMNASYRIIAMGNAERKGLRALIKEAYDLADGHKVPGVATTKFGYRRVSTYWLRKVASRLQELETVLATLDESSEEYQVVDDAGRTYLPQPTGHFSVAVNRYCELTGEDPDTIDSVHAYE